MICVYDDFRIDDVNIEAVCLKNPFLEKTRVQVCFWQNMNSISHAEPAPHIYSCFSIVKIGQEQTHFEPSAGP